uniref:SFR19-like C-terminal domain-containing protein n=1 Tax=Sus scrofa TaxID=9823 RepID=A0A8D0Q3K2_PIG
MEEEDESRGKTEESGEDRADGPPDRDPALSPSAFILRAIQQAVGSSLQGDLPNDKDGSRCHGLRWRRCRSPRSEPRSQESGGTDTATYLKKLHTQERAVEEVKLAIKPYYQKKDITKDEYKDILRKAVHKICHSKSGEINPVKVSNLVRAYVQRYRYFRKHGRKPGDPPGPPRPPKEPGPPDKGGPGLPLPPL